MAEAAVRGITITIRVTPETILHGDPALADALNALLALAEPQPRQSTATDGLIDAAELARRFGLSRYWIYGHADDIGAIRLGNGPRPRLRFHPQTVAERLTACSPSRRSPPPETPVTNPNRRRRRNPPLGTGSGLLPIRGRSDASRPTTIGEEN